MRPGALADGLVSECASAKAHLSVHICQSRLARSLMWHIYVYLAGDIGSTIELSRNFQSGLRFGVFATITDVSTVDYGEGSFDKGIFFNIPIYGNLIDYTWRPLTKDPGARLIRKNTLHDLLVRFKPVN